jgi:hypothetical protein
MRIVYEFHGKDPCVSGGGSLYALRIDRPPEWPGFRVELVLCDTEQPKDGKPFFEGDAIHWEGDGDTIRNALKQALSIVDFAEQHALEQFAKQMDRTERCPQCGCWVERLSNNQLMSHHAVLSNTEDAPLCPEGQTE